MNVAATMTRDVEFIAADASVAEAAALMGDLSVGALPVGSSDNLQGILTDRDILFRVVAKSLDARATTVGDIMTTTLFSCRPEDSAATALNLMGARNIRRLPVLDADGVVVGLVTLADLSRRLLLDNEAIQHAVRDGVEATA